MAKINTLTVEGTKKDGYTVTAMTDVGDVIEIKEGFEFVTMDSYTADVTKLSDQIDTVRAECDTDREAMRMANVRDLEALQAQIETLRSTNRDNEIAIEALHADLGALQQQLAAKPADVRTPLMHHEHQDIPTARTVDKLASLGALAPSPTLDEPQPYRPELDPDAPARPPGPGELVKEHGEYRGVVIDNGTPGFEASNDGGATFTNNTVDGKRIE